MNIPTRRCDSCQRLLPETPEFFNRNAHSRGGLMNICRDCRKAKRAREYRENPALREKVRDRAKRHYWRDPEASRAARRQYAMDHAEEAVERVRRWRAQHPERYKRQNAYSAQRYQGMKARRAHKLAASGTHTTEDIRAQYSAQDGLCFWCCTPVGDIYHVDHVVPLSRFGSDGPENLVIACPSCNSSKGTKLPYLEWDPPNPLLGAV